MPLTVSYSANREVAPDCSYSLNFSSDILKKKAQILDTVDVLVNLDFQMFKIENRQHEKNQLTEGLL